MKTICRFKYFIAIWLLFATIGLTLLIVDSIKLVNSEAFTICQPIQLTDEVSIITHHNGNINNASFVNNDSISILVDGELVKIDLK